MVTRVANGDGRDTLESASGTSGVSPRTLARRVGTLMSLFYHVRLSGSDRLAPSYRDGSASTGNACSAESVIAQDLPTAGPNDLTTV